MQKFVETITFKKGNGSLGVSAGLTATIYDAGTTNLSTLYADDEVATLTNPLSSDANGLVQCKLANGTYDIVYSTGAASLTVSGVVAYDPDGAAYNPAAVAITGGTINGVTIGGTSPPNATLNNLTVNGDFHN
jgi:hypothetical protein